VRPPRAMLGLVRLGLRSFRNVDEHDDNIVEIAHPATRPKSDESAVLNSAADYFKRKYSQ